MQNELMSRIAAQAEAKRKYDNARSHLVALTSINGARTSEIRQACDIRDEALLELLNAVQMTNIVSGETPIADYEVVPKFVMKAVENIAEDIGETALSLKVAVAALEIRLRSRLEACACTFNNCQACHADLQALKQVAG